MKVLLAAGASVDAADNDGCTALRIAATSSMQSAPTVKFLLMRRATVDAVDTGGRTPLHHAIAATGQQQFQHSSQGVPQFQQLTTAAGQRCMLLLPSSHPEATTQQSSRATFLQLVPQ